jgi:hypothetical protein
MKSEPESPTNSIAGRALEKVSRFQSFKVSKLLALAGILWNSETLQP